MTSSSVSHLSTNPAEVYTGGLIGFGPVWAQKWNVGIWNGTHTTPTTGWYGDVFSGSQTFLEYDTPGMDSGSPAYGYGGHSEFEFNMTNVISRGAGFLIHETTWQQNGRSDTGQYDYWWHEGGCWNGDDECYFHSDSNGGELSYDYQATVTTGGASGGATGGVTGYYLKTNCTSNCVTYDPQTKTYQGGAQGDLHTLIDTTSPYASGHFESLNVPSGNIPGTAVVDFTVTPSSAWGTLTAGCGATAPVNPVGVGTAAVTCSVNLNGISTWGNSPGSFTTSTIACFSGQYPECAFPTAVGTPSGGVQSVSFNLLFPHNSGSVIMQGGPAETFADILVNRGQPNFYQNQTLKYGVDIIGAINSNTLVDVFFFRSNAGQVFSLCGTANATNWNCPAGYLEVGKTSVGQVVNFTNTAGTVTMTLNNGSQSYATWNGNAVYISNATDSTFNGPCTNFRLNTTNWTGTCTQSSSSGHTSANGQVAVNCSSAAGCTANAYGNGDVILWRGAQVRDVQDPGADPNNPGCTANCIDGYLAIAPNPWTWNTGDTVEELHDASGSTVSEKSYTTASSSMDAANGADSREMYGSGVMNPWGDDPSRAGYDSGFLSDRGNREPFTSYGYYGGFGQGPAGLVLRGPITWGLDSEYPPLPGGALVSVFNCPWQQGSLGGCDDPSYYFDVIRVRGHGLIGDGLTYWPHTRTLQDAAGALGNDPGIWKLGYLYSFVNDTPHGFCCGWYPVLDTHLMAGGGYWLPTLASNSGFTTGHFVSFTNTTGEEQDSGYGVSSFCQSNGTNCPSGSGGVTVTTTTTSAVTISGTAGYYYNADATAAQAVTYTLPTPVAGMQFCASNFNNGTTGNTGQLELLVANTGTESIVYQGAKSSSGYIQSSGAAGDMACVTAVSTTQWAATVSMGVWTLH